MRIEIPAQQVDVAPDGAFSLRGKLVTPAPEPPPAPVPGVPAVNRVVVGDAWHPLDAIDPTPASNPAGYLEPAMAGRGANQLVAVTEPGTSRFNRFGVEVLLSEDDVVIAVVDRTPGRPPLVVAPGQILLAAHGSAATWALKSLPLQAKVTFAHSLEPAPTVPAGGWSGPSLATWVQLWSNSPRHDIGALHLAYDEIRLSFLQGQGVLPGWGPHGRDELVRQLNTFMAMRPGRRIALSVGGGGYTVDLSSPTGFVSKAKEIEKRLQDAGLSHEIVGWNWDWESRDFAANATKVIAVSERVRETFSGGGFLSWCPNGVYKDDYRATLRGRGHLVDEIVQQFYDSEVSQAQANTEVQKYVDQFGAAKTGMAVMLGPERTYWDLSEAVSYSAEAVRRWGCQRFALWEIARPGTNDYAMAMSKVLTR